MRKWPVIGRKNLLRWGLLNKEDDHLAFSFFKRSSELDFLGAHCSLGYMYEQGRGTSKNIYEAERYYLKAANLNHASAQCNLGFLYEHKDEVKSFFWYSRAAKQNHPRAVCNLALAQLARHTGKNEMESVRLLSICTPVHTRAKKILSRLLNDF
eukprot:c5252_g1_i2.p1 GENE.c5252_g1_i2~~c5252_g1_i2.p1  ORF type:complete len:154 (-),score=22.80 c5252_g1_i2:19-480(-)